MGTKCRYTWLQGCLCKEQGSLCLHGRHGVKAGGCVVKGKFAVVVCGVMLSLMGLSCVCVCDSTLRPSVQFHFYIATVMGITLLKI